MADVGLKQRREQSVVLGVITADSMIYNSEKFMRRIFRKGSSLKSDIKFFQLLYLHQFLVTLVLSVTTCSLTSYCVVLTMAMATKKLDGVVVGNKRGAEEMDIHADNHVQNKDNQSGPGDQFAYVERYEMKE